MRRDRELEKLDDAQLVRVALPMQLIRVTERGEPITGPQLFEQFLRAWQHASRPCRELRQEFIRLQIDVPVADEPFSPLDRGQFSTLELLGVRAFGPPLEDDFRRRRPAKVLSELLRPGKLDKHAAEIEQQ